MLLSEQLSFQFEEAADQRRWRRYPKTFTTKAQRHQVLIVKGFSLCLGALVVSLHLRNLRLKFSTPGDVGVCRLALGN
jgi:hypothetical protein